MYLPNKIVVKRVPLLYTFANLFNVWLKRRHMNFFYQSFVILHVCGLRKILPYALERKRVKMQILLTSGNWWPYSENPTLVSVAWPLGPLPLGSAFISRTFLSAPPLHPVDGSLVLPGMERPPSELGLGSMPHWQHISPLLSNNSNRNKAGVFIFICLTLLPFSRLFMNVVGNGSHL